MVITHVKYFVCRTSGNNEQKAICFRISFLSLLNFIKSMSIVLLFMKKKIWFSTLWLFCLFCNKQNRLTLYWTLYFVHGIEVDACVWQLYIVCSWAISPIQNYGSSRSNSTKSDMAVSSFHYHAIIHSITIRVDTRMLHIHELNH